MPPTKKLAVIANERSRRFDAPDGVFASDTAPAQTAGVVQVSNLFASPKIAHRTAQNAVGAVSPTRFGIPEGVKRLATLAPPARAGVTVVKFLSEGKELPLWIYSQ